MPLVVLGARQVGKTYIIKEFCQNEFPNFYYLNLLENDLVANIYQEQSTSEAKFNKLKALLNISEENNNTILFIDEIQESEELISSLKFICENHNEMYVICAGSLLGVKLRRLHKPFPVGKVKMLDMFPMDFEEFLLAFEKKYLIDSIKECYQKNKSMLEAFHNEAIDYYNLYLYTGGMPLAVKNIVQSKGSIAAFDQTIIKDIVNAYLLDMSRYVTNNSETLKIMDVYKNIPIQLGNKSCKFQASLIEKNKRMKDYDTPIDWLMGSQMILKCQMISKPNNSLALMVKNDFFKLYLSDTGILSYLSGTDYKDLIFNQDFINKGIFAENYVAIELIQNNIPLYYWKSDYEAEIDFLIKNDDGIIPIEVKASDNTQPKSLKTYMDNFKPKYGIRISTKNFGYVNNIKSIPLYAVFCLK